VSADPESEVVAALNSSSPALRGGTVNRSPTIIKIIVLGAMLLSNGLAVGQPAGAAPDSIEVTISNFRYCTAQTCSPADQGYVRLTTGPVTGTDNPHGITDVPEGATVRWVYRDTGPGSCHFLEQCTGHDVRFEDGTAKGVAVGGARARSGAAEITTTITQSAGTLIRYFCSINDHYQLGMTSILRVVPPGS
jgi:plastocyanin